MENLDIDTEKPTQLALAVVADIEAGTLDDCMGAREAISKIPGMMRLAYSAIARSLAARKFYYNMQTKKMAYEPDFRAQLEAAKLLFAYREGLPAQTVVTVEVGGKNKGGADEILAEQLRQSPALRSRLRGELERAEKAAKAGAITV